MDLLSRAHGRDDQAAGALCSVAFIVLVDEGKSSVGGGCGGGQFGGQSLVGTCYFVTVLQSNRAALVDCGTDNLIVVRNFPQYLAVGSLFDVFVSEAGNLFVTVEHDPEALTSGALLQKCLDPGRTPERYDISLGDHQHGIRQITDHLHGGVDAAGTIHHYKVVLAHEQIEQTRQFGGGGDGILGLLCTRQKVKPAAIVGHQSFEQRNVH